MLRQSPLSFGFLFSPSARQLLSFRHLKRFGTAIVWTGKTSPPLRSPPGSPAKSSPAPSSSSTTPLSTPRRPYPPFWKSYSGKGIPLSPSLSCCSPVNTPSTIPAVSVRWIDSKTKKRNSPGIFVRGIALIIFYLPLSRSVRSVHRPKAWRHSRPAPSPSARRGCSGPHGTWRSTSRQRE